MSLTWCDYCGIYVDLDYNSEHFYSNDVCGRRLEYLYELLESMEKSLKYIIKTRTPPTGYDIVLVYDLSEIASMVKRIRRLVDDTHNNTKI